VEDGSTVEPMKDSVIECEEESMNLDSTTLIMLHMYASRAVAANQFCMTDSMVIQSYSTLDGLDQTSLYSFIDRQLAMS
jgi:hypothetical protein